MNQGVNGYRETLVGMMFFRQSQFLLQSHFLCPTPSEPMHELSVTRLSLVRSLRFCAGHRLLGHEGRCAYLHGHNYRVDVEVEPTAGGSEVDAVGRVVDFALIKRRLLGWLDDHWDHAFILWDSDTTALAAVTLATPTKYFLLPWNPTAENMARYLLEAVAPHVLADLGVVATRVAVWESDESCAIATRSGEASVSPVPIASAILVDTRS